MKLSEILLAARDRVAQGWTQGQMTDMQGKVCLAGGVENVLMDEFGLDVLGAAEDKLPAILTWIDQMYFGYTRKNSYNPFQCVMWNDKPERQQEDVVDLLDTLAKIAKDSGDIDYEP